MPRKLPEEIYGNAVNLKGLYSKWPVKLFLQTFDDQEPSYKRYASINELLIIDAEKDLGLQEQEGVITFTSKYESEVRLWTEGVKSSMKILRQWCGPETRKK